MNSDVKRSKIYSYFYGANTVFQQFVIIVGILFLMMTSVAVTAQYAKLNSLRDKSYELGEETSSAKYEYESCYYGSIDLFDVEKYEYATVTKGEEYYDKKTEYNDALKKYEKSNEKSEKAYEKLEKARNSAPITAGVCRFLGFVLIIAGFIWFLYKKLSYDKSGETAVDEELASKIEEAKQKGLEKLNIISEQIERVEPVVLNGVAHTDGDAATAMTSGRITGLFRGIFKFVLAFDKIIIGCIAAGIFTALSNAFVGNGLPFVIIFIAMVALVGFVGYQAYKKFEIDSYVKPKTIERLSKFAPHFVAKLGSDDKVRVSLPAITVYMFGNDQLYMYYQYLDIVTGKIFCEGVHEYFYEDIVGITSTQETRKIFKRYGFMNLFLRSIDYLKESITVVSSGCMHKESYVVDMGNSLLDTRFVGMRNLIRQKKMEK